MACYFFHSQTDAAFTDKDGVDFATPAEARAEAIRLAGEMLKDAPDSFWSSRPWSITVTNEAGLTLWEMSLHGTSFPASQPLD